MLRYTGTTKVPETVYDNKRIEIRKAFAKDEMRYIAGLWSKY
jgi:hypothetical protein